MQKFIDWIWRRPGLCESGMCPATKMAWCLVVLICILAYFYR